jgi:hypothetical protein
LWTLTWSLPGVVLAWVFWSPAQSESVLLGAAIGVFNLQLLGGAVFRALNLHDLRSDEGPARAATLLSTLRWGVTALATVGILWYMAGQPEGLVLGFTLSLVGFISSAVHTNELSQRSSR